MNWPNRITIVRIFLIPLFMVFLFTRVPYGEYLATIVFILAAGTDGLDGYMARSRNEVTKLGKFLDPLADKLLISAALVSLVELNLMAAWPAVLIIGREFAVTGLRTIAAGEGVVIAASPLGKLKTISQTIAIILLLQQELIRSYVQLPVGEATLYIALILTVISALDYFYKIKVSWKNKTN